MGFDPSQLRELITEVLTEANLFSESAVELLMLTAATESNLGTYIKQVGGPALGIFQMEPATHRDIWHNYLVYKKELTYPLRELVPVISHDDLKYNLAYAILMARIHYLRVSEALPEADDIEGLAAYWKNYYNTHLGKGTVEKAMEAYNMYC